MILLRLFYEFFKTGLFSIGGGMATLPFLKEIGESTGWYTYGDLLNMLAVSESTPGPIGINMATYVGYTVAGIPGVLAATIGEVTPCVIIILIVAAVLKSFRNNPYVDRAFYGLRPASAGLIGAAAIAVVLEVLLRSEIFFAEGALLGQFRSSGSIHWLGIVLAAVLYVLTNRVKATKKLHPIVFIIASAVIGVVFRFAGA